MTSSCYHHFVIWTETSSCYHHVTILALHHALPTRDGMHVLQKLTGMHAPFTRAGLACTPFNTTDPYLQYHRVSCHVGNNISETYPRRIGQGLNDASCMLNRMLSSLMGLPNPAWVSLGNVVSHMGELELGRLTIIRLSSSCDLDRDIIMLSSCDQCVCDRVGHWAVRLALHHALPTRDGMHAL
jgi:hypothetical protein